MAGGAMKYSVLATDYDGTMAHDGRVDDATIDALRRARAAGLRLIMVTGRELSDLFNTFADTALFDLIVAENGAVLHVPADQSMHTLAPSPPPSLLSRLAEDAIPVSVGHSVVATIEPYEHQVLAAIRDLGLEWHVIFNKGSVMALPSEVTKATGLAAALEHLGLAAEDTVGIGDAENDHSFLRVCGLAVAVQNALPSVKAMADIVTDGARGEGVIEIIDQLVDGGLDEVLENPAKRGADSTG
jgi:hydroxymethylpyrimidine pyrophosphatase-like HAD family hydrolase